jgi:uncharacterized membrane protein YcaP (DUF421 family)
MFLDIFSKLFFPSVPVWEIVLRGSVIYIVLFILFRFQKREIGSLESNDLLVLVLIADASQNAMAGNYHSITDGIVLVIVIMAWAHLVNWLAYNFPVFKKILRPPKLLLIDEGKMIRKNMRRECITNEELVGELRKNGIDDINKVAKAFMESDGTITIVPEKEEKIHPKRKKKQV